MEGSGDGYVRSLRTLRDGELRGRICLFTRNSERYLKGGSTDRAFLSMGAPFRGTWRGGSFVGDPECYERKALGTAVSLYGGSLGNLGWANLWGLRDMAEGALGMECLSPWGFCEGNLEGGSLSGDPDGHLEKALEMGISVYRGSAFGEPGGGLVYRGL